MRAAHTKTVPLAWFVIYNLGRDKTACHTEGSAKGLKRELDENGWEDVEIVPVQACNDHAELKRRAECVDELVAALQYVLPIHEANADAARRAGFTGSMSIKAHQKVKRALSHVATATEQSNTRVKP